MRRRTAAAQRYHNRAGAGTGWALEQKSTAGAGLKFRLSQNAVPSFGALQAARQSDTKPRSLDIERNSFNELPEKFKAVARARAAARFRERGALPRLSAGRTAIRSRRATPEPGRPV
jgi:hypothetical protein